MVDKRRLRSEKKFVSSGSLPLLLPPEMKIVALWYVFSKMTYLLESFVWLIAFVWVEVSRDSVILYLLKISYLQHERRSVSAKWCQ